MKNVSLIEIIEPDPPFWTKTSWLQLGYGIWVNLTITGIGLAFGWSAVTIPQLLQDDSSFKLSVSEEAWIGSVLTLSSPVGCLMSGFIMDRFGRRIVLVLCEVPMFCGWFYTGFAKSPLDIIIGRTLSGIGIGMALGAPRTYITEITLPNMRGVIGAIPNLAISLGLTAQASLGTFLKWYTLCYICGTYSICLMFLNMFLPDTPYFILMKHTANDARFMLQKFRSSKFNIDAEMNDLEDYKTTNHIRRLTFKEQMKELVKISTCKPFGISITYIIITQISGVNVIIMWAVEMLELSKSSVDPNFGNIILGLTRMGFGFLTSILLFKVGRRVMALTSAIGVGIVSIALGTYIYTSDSVTVYPLVFFVSYIAFATLGYYTLPFLIMFELYPLQIRGVLGGISVSLMNIVMFSMNRFYPLVRDEVGLAFAIAIFGINSLIGAIILYFILPETKNLTLQEIEEYFNATRPTLVSQRRVMSTQLANMKSSSVILPKTNLKQEQHKSKDKDSKVSGEKIKNFIKRRNTSGKEQVESGKKQEESDKEQDDENKASTSTK